MAATYRVSSSDDSVSIAAVRPSRITGCASGVDVELIVSRRVTATLLPAQDGADRFDTWGDDPSLWLSTPAAIDGDLTSFAQWLVDELVRRGVRPSDRERGAPRAWTPCLWPVRHTVDDLIRDLGLDAYGTPVVRDGWLHFVSATGQWHRVEVVAALAVWHSALVEEADPEERAGLWQRAAGATPGGSPHEAGGR